MRGGAYEVVYGPSPSGGEVLGDSPVIGFRGPGEPGARRGLTGAEREEKRRRNKARRQAIRRARR